MQVESFSIPSSFPSPPSAASGGKSAAGAEGDVTPDVTVTGQAKAQPVSSEQSGKLEKVLGSIQEAIQSSNISLQFSQDEDTGSIVIKLIDQNSGEAIQQIPSKAVLHLAAALGKLQGQIFDRKA